MKKITILTILMAVVLITGCDKKSDASEHTDIKTKQDSSVNKSIPSCDDNKIKEDVLWAAKESTLSYRSNYLAAWHKEHKGVISLITVEQTEAEIKELKKKNIGIKIKYEYYAYLRDVIIKCSGSKDSCKFYVNMVESVEGKMLFNYPLDNMPKQMNTSNGIYKLSEKSLKMVKKIKTYLNKTKVREEFDSYILSDTHTTNTNGQIRGCRTKIKNLLTGKFINLQGEVFPSGYNTNIPFYLMKSNGKWTTNYD